MTIVHNSREKGFRWPMGAVCARQRVKIAIDIDIEERFSSVMLRTWRENVGETLYSMEKAADSSDGRRYVSTLEMPEHGCLVWYYFIIVSKTKTFFYGNNAGRLGGEGAVYDKEPPAFQITVYNEGADTPAWFKNAVMYQIFPDRFRRSGINAAEKAGRVVHASWDDAPCYYKDPDTKEIIDYDFFGGNLAGMREKLPYLKELGIGVVYLNPVFESQSNHHYDTGDYHKIDPFFGTNEEFAAFCAEAKAMGIRIILDGVFSHTGSDSKYFNRYGNYDGIGAFQSVLSPYYEWYDFKNYPYEYMSWWGFDTLPNVKETTESYMNFIINDENSVLKYWIKQGISGWRLDVIDELPSSFSRRFYQVMKETDPEAVLIGEVWEDASNKVSYGTPREYLCGPEMDSAMNYPFRSLALDFMLGRASAEEMNLRLLSLYENYPRHHFYAMMNLVGSHDVERVLTVLGEALHYEGMPAVRQARFRMTNEQYQIAVSRLKILSLWQMTFPGVPCVYYGDEAGMQGFRDPHNRAPYCWGREDAYLQSWYKRIIGLRNENAALRTGEFHPVWARGEVYAYVRRVTGGRDVFGEAAEDGVFLVVMNRGNEERSVSIPVRGLCRGTLEDTLGSLPAVKVRGGKAAVTLRPLQAAVFRQQVEPVLPRGAGVLLHPTSLPSKYGVGDFGKGAYEFVNFLARGKQKFWQVLPLNPVGYGYSPYQSPSAFAGNPALISLGKLVTDGLLKPQEIKVPANGLDFDRAWQWKDERLRVAQRRFIAKENADYEAFCDAEAHWLDDYALYMALKQEHGGVSWNEWEPALIRREPVILERYRKRLAPEIAYQKFLQFEFSGQWLALKRYANERGIRIVGDMPIFIAHDSADVWSNQKLFALDAKGRAVKVAGVPPDYFSETGQLWGNPHYLWDEMAKDDYAWWRKRFAALLAQVDIARIDHFRGFEAYWEVAGSAETAIDGKWVNGPGEHFFRTIEKYFGKLPLIAEDLGVITDAVNDLKDEFSYPGMKVLHFELLPDDEGKVDFDCEQNCIVYTGTHDNNTTVGWLAEDLDERAEKGVYALLEAQKSDRHAACEALVRYAYASNAATAIVPLQDFLALDGTARMNLPGTIEHNWQWRAPAGSFTDKLADRLADLCKTYNR